jgi:hypothetical protein
MGNNDIENDILKNELLQNNNQNILSQDPNTQIETFVQPQIQQPNIYINTNNISDDEIIKSKKIN